MTSENESVDDPGEGASIPKKKKSIHRAQKFRNEWRTMPEFRDWLLPDPNDEYRATCKYWGASIVAEITNIKLHGRGKKHTSLTSSSTVRQSSITQFVSKPSCPTTSVSRAEIKIAGYFSEHNIAFNAADHFVEVVKDIFPDSKISQQMSLKRTKLTSVVVNVIGASHKEQLVQKIKDVPFSVLTDETTDIAKEKTSCVAVRYFDRESGRIETKFWELYKVFDSANADEGATGKTLFEGLCKTFDNYDIPWKENVVGFASDGASVMMGCHNSVSSRFQEACQGIVIMRCICHSAHLCASEACKVLPRSCEDLARNIYSFLCSSKRQTQLEQFQEYLNLEPHKLLHPSQNRWLSLVAVVERLLEQWDALRLFFIDKWFEERLVTAEETFKSLHDPFMKLYYQFLAWVLPKFTQFNKYFQSSQVVVTEIHERVRALYKELLLCFMKRTYVVEQDLSNVDPDQRNYYLSDQEMYLGVAVLQNIDTPPVLARPDLRNDFINRCRLFLKVAASQIRSRYNMDDPLLSQIHTLKPQNALQLEFRDSMPLVMAMPRAVSTEGISQSIDDQWRRLPLSLAQLPDYVRGEDIFWGRVLKDMPEFKELAVFALSVLTLPHSNADCERVFSKVNLMKTKHRNKLHTSTVNGTLLSSECMKQAGNCVKFQPTKSMLNKMKSANLYLSSTKNDDPESE